MGCYWWDCERGICRYPWKDYDVCLGKNCKDYVEDEDSYMMEMMNEKIPNKLDFTLK